MFSNCILTSSQETPPSVGVSDVGGAPSWKSLSTPSCVLVHCPCLDAGGKGVCNGGEADVGSEDEWCPEGQWRDSWCRLCPRGKTHMGKAGICFKGESARPWLWNDAHTQRGHGEEDPLDSQWKKHVPCTAAVLHRSSNIWTWTNLIRAWWRRLKQKQHERFDWLHGSWWKKIVHIYTDVHESEQLGSNLLDFYVIS